MKQDSMNLEDDNKEETGSTDTVINEQLQTRISYSQALTSNLPERTRKFQTSFLLAIKKRNGRSMCSQLYKILDRTD